MRKKYLMLFLSAMLSFSLIACSNEHGEKQITDSEETSIASKEDDEYCEDSLLPFGFTPEEFIEDFANFASFSCTYVNSAKEVVQSSWCILVDNPDGDDLGITLFCNSDGKVSNISISDTKNQKFVDTAKAAISATDIHFDADKLEKELDLSNLPTTFDDSKLITEYGISLILTPDNFMIQRDDEKVSDYNYIEIHSNSKAEAENYTQSNNTSENSSSVQLTMGQSNALRSAKSYLDYTAFSYSGLIEQLEYEGFSTEDATFAADNCGADWNEQAAKMAQSYIEYSSFSRQGLIDQLKYEGFSSEQAEYGVSAIGY